MGLFAPRGKSVRRMYTIMILLAILLSVVVVGALGIYTIWGKTNKDVVTIMNLTTESKADELDLILLKTTDAVDTVSAYVGARVATSNKQLDEEVLQRGLEKEIQELFQSSLENMEGAVGYYIRFAEPYNELVEGFAFRRTSDKEDFVTAPEESLSDPSDGISDGDWYSLAKSSGESIWIPIRECSYMEGYIYSYAVPIYFGKDLVGVACVDVDFETLARPVRDISLFGGGYAYLTSDKGQVYYHPLIGYGVLLTEDDDDVPEVDAALADTSTHGKLITYEYHGQEKTMTFQSLINDMRLVVTANVEDVEHETVSLIWRIILSALAIMLVFMILALEMERRTMRQALEKMDSQAHMDGLTGLQNRTSFLEKQNQLNRKIRDGGADFGFVMFDVNDLKKINDVHGHRMGDIYLLSSVEMIRESFPEDQAYRIGGDEFAVLLEGEKSLRRAEDHLQTFDARQKKCRDEKENPWEKPSVACAFVRFDPAVHHASEEVLSEADALMYQKKKNMKD